MFTFLLSNFVMYTYIASEYHDWNWIFPLDQWGILGALTLLWANVFFVLPVLFFRMALGKSINYLLWFFAFIFSVGV